MSLGKEVDGPWAHGARAITDDWVSSDFVGVHVPLYELEGIRWFSNGLKDRIVFPRK